MPNHKYCLLKPKINFRKLDNNLHVEIETSRLLIRTYKDSDFENSVSLYGDEKLAKYFDHGKARTRDEVKHLIYNRSTSYIKNGEPFGIFSIFEKKDKSFMGQFDLLTTENYGELEIGCILHRKYHNQGLASEICKIFIHDYISELNAQRTKYNIFPIFNIIATAHPQNFASQKLIKNLGMCFEKAQDRFGNPRLWYFFNTSIFSSMPEI